MADRGRGVSEQRDGVLPSIGEKLTAEDEVGTFSKGRGELCVNRWIFRFSQKEVDGDGLGFGGGDDFEGLRESAAEALVAAGDRVQSALIDDEEGGLGLPRRVALAAEHLIVRGLVDGEADEPTAEDRDDESAGQKSDVCSRTISERPHSYLV
jgi:hypothetical protein